MASLVADYSSGSESSYDSESFSCDVSDGKAENSGLPKPNSGLPKPDFQNGTSDKRSVFVNPFVAADNAKIAILEKHVKMISTDVETVNGKKICWNYRKNKCRFGHNCKYAHDSDVQLSPGPAVAAEPPGKQEGMVGDSTGGANPQSTANKTKKRPLVSETTVPSEKVMKTTNQHKSKKKNCSC